MKKVTPLFLLFFVLNLKSNAQAEKNLKEVMKLTITEQGGANGATVLWQPDLKRYYCPMAGNTDFPLQVFNAKGELISAPAQTTFFDVRGMWYNPKTKKLYTNGYNESGWAEYQMDKKGMPIAVKVLYEGLNQPDMQSVGTYDAAKNLVYFYNNNAVHIYDASSGAATGSVITLIPSEQEKKTESDSSDVFDFMDDEDLNNYNSTTVIYTGIKSQEFGLLNLSNKCIDLFDRATGKVTLKLMLPQEAPLNNMFNFSYANGMYWLFNKSTRIWTAYK